eukprot:gi/632979675/ref/XP_007906600.1/ PREDICTED: uncharacterized protein C16orf11 homolog [Callorhinchus milii]
MSEEGVACKLGALYKHKERKPKKPHYIPRPWGKPYNYKCFQCPFTCMEKSHLYNHMKYSLCKNSLSLLVGSDWPYRKSDSERAAPEQRDPRERSGKETERGEVAEGGSPDAEDPPAPRRKWAKLSDRAGVRAGPGVGPDAFAPKEKTLPGAEPEATKPKQYRLPKSCVVSGSGGGGNMVLLDQWRLVTSRQRETPAGTSSPPCPDPASAIPCYPPPPGLRGYREAPALNLSALGVNYPGSHHSLLFSSYLSPAIAAHPTPAAPVAPLPFLASPARLAGPQPAFGSPGPGKAEPPVSSTAPDPLPPPPPPPPPAQPADETPLRKVPALRPTAPEGLLARVHHRALGSGGEPGTQLDHKPQASHKPEPPVRGQSPKPEAGHTSPDPKGAEAAGAVGDAPKAEGPPGRSGASGAAAAGSEDVSRRFLAEPLPAPGLSSSPGSSASLPHPPPSEQVLRPNHSCPPAAEEDFSPPRQKPFRHWTAEPCVYPKDRPNSPEPGRLTRPASSPGCVSARKGSRNPECLQKGEGSNDSTVLIDDLCKVIHEYQEVEEQLCLMDNEDTPGQKQLRSQLTKIRKELLHIRQTLEKTTKQHEGPLDLSVKRSLDGIVKDHKSGGGGGGNLEGQDPPRPLVDQVQPSDGSKESRASRTALKYSAGTDDRSILDGRTRICEAEDLRASPEHGEGPAVKPSISEPPKSGPTDTALANRTTKCEADSSVPLGMDGRFGSSQPGLACPALEDDSKPPRSKSLKRSLSGDGQSERETGCRLSLLVGERLKQSRVV